MIALDETKRQKLVSLAERLIDQKAARVLIAPYEDSSGFWFGSGGMIEHERGNFYLVGRYRNEGDSRTGLSKGERGAELAIFRSSDRGRSFNKILSFSKQDISYPGRPVISIEGTALHMSPDGVELFISSEKDGLGYPESLAEYQKPGTGVWTIDVIRARRIEDLDPNTIENLIECTDPRWLHVKDPVVWRNREGDTVLVFCTHPYNWTCSNSAVAIRKAGSENFCGFDYTFFLRGFTWDVAMSRITGVLQVPRSGVFGEGPAGMLFFYDGGECVRNLDEHTQAVRRPRGYSCEELGGLAFCWEQEFPALQRLSVIEPLFVSPYGTGCSRYVKIFAAKDGVFALWQQSQGSLAQPLMVNFVPENELNRMLG